MKKFLALLSIFALSSLPNLALAQEDASTTQPDPAPVEDTSSSTPDIPVADATPVQEATSSQASLPSTLLEQGDNPQDQGNSSANDMSSTGDNSTASSTASTTEDVVDTLDATSTPVADLPTEILKPTKEYTFEVNGAAVATVEAPDWTKPAADKDKNDGSNSIVTEAPEVDTGTPHTLTVSGECDTPYYVILIYKDPGDYNANPASYIFNRAFSCDNGQYSYDVKDLPFDLETGTFYLMVAGQGDKGPWKPITALIPIGITVKTIIPESSSTETNAAN